MTSMYNCAIVQRMTKCNYLNRAKNVHCIYFSVLLFDTSKNE